MRIPARPAWPPSLKSIASSLISLLCLFLPSCAIRVGPTRIVPDRFNYAAAITTSWKEQMLTNLVRLRYLDPPVFLDVAQIVTQYTMERSASITSPAWKGNSSGPAAGVSGYWAESPTITYNLLSGDKFTKSLLEPASIISIMQLVESGWPIDAVLGVAVTAVNGLYASAGARSRHEGDPRFYELLKLMRELQLRNAFSTRVVSEKGDKRGAEKGAEEEELLVFGGRRSDSEAQAMTKTVKELLGLNPDLTEFHMVFGAMNRDDTEIACLTRTMLDILSETAEGAEIPAADLDEGRATKPPVAKTEGELDLKQLVRVRSSAHKPDAKEAFTAIQYRGYWFWIDDRDINSKRGLDFLMMLFTLASPNATISLPGLTIAKP